MKTWLIPVGVVEPEERREASHEALKVGVGAESTEPIELTVVVPTFKEAENVPVLLARLRNVLADVEWEVLYVDDHSPDGTADVVRQIALSDRRVRVIERIGRRGLASACVEGMMASAAPYIAVMDADLQHDESVIPEMLRRIKGDRLDVVIASRRTPGGSMGDFSKARVKLSEMGRRISKLVCRCEVSDTMSGFFMVEARFFRALVPYLTATGFKILVDILASSPIAPRVGEVPYSFRIRQLGESKLDLNVQLEYVFLIMDKSFGKWFPTRFALYLLVGTLGILVHLAVLAPLYLNHPHYFPQAQLIATVIAMTFNFLLNNMVTFQDRRLRGLGLVKGLSTFYAACSLGAVINVAFANLLIHQGVTWYLAGMAGIGISAVWNYGVNAELTWRRSRA